MKPLLAEPEVTATPTPGAGVPDAPESPRTPVVAPEPEARTCDACGAAMAVEQDWCLDCGTAAPGRLGARPGWRAVVSVVGVTLVLAGSAVAASYAALSEDASRQASAPPPPAASPLAQTPPALPPASVPPAPDPASEAVAPGATPPTATLPTVPTPSGAVTPSLPTPVIPSTPIVPSTPSTGSSGSGSGGGTDSGGSGDDTPAGGDTSSEGSGGPSGGQPAGRTPIALGADAITIYDPYGRATVKGDPADAYDDDLDTIFRLGVASPDGPMNVGMVVDLEKTTSVRALELRTDTPGFRVETYGATGSEIPPDILDTRWRNFGGRSKVDEGTRDGNTAGDEIERVSLGGEREIRYLLVWFTAPPTRGATVRITEAKLLG